MGKKGVSDKPTCSKCGVLLDETNWYENRRNPKTRYLVNLGKFYALRLFICKTCWQKRSKEVDAARRRRLKELDPSHVFTQYQGLRLAWRGDFVRRMTSMEVRTISMEAEKTVTEKVLPEEGFSDIVWLHNHHAPFDIVARKGSQSFMIDVTTAPYKSFASTAPGNKQALMWLLRNASLKLLIVYVAPDFKIHYQICPIGRKRFEHTQGRPEIRQTFESIDIERAWDTNQYEESGGMIVSFHELLGVVRA